MADILLVCRLDAGIGQRMLSVLSADGILVKVEPPDFIVTLLHQFHNSYPFVGQLLVIMAIDVATGFLAACIAKTVSSTTAFQGMVRKAIMLLLVGLGVILEPYAQDVPLGKMLALCFTIVEGLSIVENAGRAGVPIPDVIKDFLVKLRSTNPVVSANSGSNNNISGSVVNVAHANNVDVHDTRSIPEVVEKRGDSVVIKGQSTEVTLVPEAISEIKSKDVLS